MRTGAVTAIGGRHLARGASRVLAHIGSRGTAEWNVRLLCAVLPGLEEVRIHSRTPESRAALAERLAAELGPRVHAVDSWEECVRGADVVVEATRLADAGAAASHGVDRAGGARRPLRHGQRRRPRSDRRDGQGRRRRLGPGPVGAARRAAGARRLRPPVRGHAARRAGPDRGGPAPGPRDATPSASCSGTAASSRPTSRSAGRCSRARGSSASGRGCPTAETATPAGELTPRPAVLRWTRRSPAPPARSPSCCRRCWCAPGTCTHRCLPVAGSVGQARQAGAAGRR